MATGKRWPLAVLAALVFSLSSQAVAQAAPDPPPVISPLKVLDDRNGVNLSSGKIDLDVPSLGVPAAPRLKWDKVQNSAPYMRGTIVAGGEGYSSGSYSVHTDGLTSESFRCQDFDCTSVTNSGSTLRTGGNQHKTGSYQRAGSAEEYHFQYVSSGNCVGSPCTVQSYADRIDYPDGERITITYDSVGLCNGPPPAPNTTCYRPNRIETNLGYFIAVTYQSDDINAPHDAWSEPLDARLYAVSAQTTPIQSLHYTFDGATMTATDIGGRQWTVVGGNNGMGGQVQTVSGSVRLPTEPSDAITIGLAPNAPLLGSFIRDGVTWTYAYTSPVLNPWSEFGDYYYSKVTVSGPNGYSMNYDMDPAYQNLPNLFINVIKKSTDALGRPTTYGWAGPAHLARVTEPEGNYTQLFWDECGNVTSKKSFPKSGVVSIDESMAYNCTGFGINQWRPVSSTDARGKVTNYTWNSGGQLTQQDDPADASGVRRRTIIDYSLFGSLSRKTKVRVCAAGPTPLTCAGTPLSQTDYTYFGNTALPATVTVTDNGNCTPTCVTETTTYGYDAAGRVTSVQGPQNGGNGTKYFQYDVYGRKCWELGAADANGLRVAKHYFYRDPDDKVTKVETGTANAIGANCSATGFTLLEQTDTTYDSRRYPIRELTSAGGAAYRITDRSFLDRGLADCTTVRMNFAAPPANACTLGTPGAQGPDRITKNLYDAAGQLTKIQKAFGTSLQQDYVTYAYTNNGKQQFVTDANGNKAQFKYDTYDRLQCWIFPSKTTPGTVSGDCTSAQPAGGDYETYTYDAAGNRLSLRRRDGRTLTFTYDNLNRMLSKLIPDGCPPIQPPGTGCPPSSATRDVFYSYDLLGRQLTAKFDSTGGADGITNAYDGFGNVTSSTISMAGFTKAVTSLYDLDNNRVRVTHPDTQAFTYAYDARDRLTGVFEGIGGAVALDGFGYNPDDTLATRLEGAGGGGSANYSYDGIGRLTGQSDAFPAAPASNVQWTFNINQASQIIGETRSNDGYAFTGITAASKAYTVNGLNQYTAVGAGPAYLYDASGNLTYDGFNAFTYDGENRLVSALAAGQTTTLTYDPLGRLWQVVKGAANTRLLYDADALVGEYNSGGILTQRYVHGSNAAADDPLVWYENGTTRRYLHADHLGSIVAATNAAAAPTVNAYDEYGVPRSGNVGRFQYTGQIWLSELGLYHYKARLYSPYLGRFLQVDPVGYKDQTNLYAYVSDDPVNGSDPTGLYETNCGGDKKCNAASTEFEKQRQVNLGSKNASVVASAKAYGDPGQANGVKVNFLSDRQMDAKYGEGVKGDTKPTLIGNKAEAKVDIRMSLHGRAMRETSAHEGTHVAQANALAETYNPKTDRYSSSLNITRLNAERQAYLVGNIVNRQFSSQQEIDQFIGQHYDNLNDTLIGKDHAE